MKKPMVIVSSYFEGENYGMLGPQMAATIIQDNTDYDCIVIAVSRKDDKTSLKKNLASFFGNERPIIGFSTLSGREDLFSFAKELKEEGALTILAGPQSDQDYMGETGCQEHPYRFQGLSDSFSYSLHGPGEQIIEFLANLQKGERVAASGLIYKDKKGELIRHSEKKWDDIFLKSVRWNNIYRNGDKGLTPLSISTGQVLQQLGCPHASHGKMLEIDYPSRIRGKEGEKIILKTKGCSFCDVAVDKGFYGSLAMENVIHQILGLPETPDRRKIPFELINENPLPYLPNLLLEIKDLQIELSQINLTLRADWLLKGELQLREALNMAGEMKMNILASSVGFEAFDDTLLRNFNKGLDVNINLEAIRLMRRLKEEFPEDWHYSKSEGAIHGFIHPTPWDTNKILSNTHKNIGIYGLERDIIPPNSTPLIIHHASALGEWIREIEDREGNTIQKIRLNYRVVV